MRRDETANPYGDPGDKITDWLRRKMIEETPDLLSRTILGSEVKEGDLLHLRGPRGGDLRGIAVANGTRGINLVESASKKSDERLTHPDPLSRSYGYGKRTVAIKPAEHYVRWGEQDAIFAAADALIVARREQDRDAREAARREQWRQERAARRATWYGQVEEEFRALGVKARYIDSWADAEHMQDQIWEVSLPTVQVQRLLAMLAEPAEG